MTFCDTSGVLRGHVKDDAGRHGVKAILLGLSFSAGLMLCAPALAQSSPTPVASTSDLHISGSFRVRYEDLAGQPRAGLNLNDSQISVRTTIFAEYQTAGLRIGGELYDSRAYLGKTGSAISANDVNALEPVQAYIAGDIAEPFGPGSKASVQAGRFTLNLGSKRLIAADDYRNATNGYTGLRADVALKTGANATFFYTLPQIRLPDDLPSVLDNKARLDKESFDLQLWGAIVTQPRAFGAVNMDVSYVRLQERDAPGRPTRDRNLQSITTRLIKDPVVGGFDYEVEGIYQFGHASASTAATAPLLPVDARFLHADFGYSFGGPAKLHLSAEYDYASGDHGGGKYTRFDTLFGMRRADFGPAGIYAAIGRTNISSPGIRAEIAPSSRWDAFATYSALWLASRTDAFSNTGVRDATGHSGKFAGHQIDGRFRYWVVPKKLRAEINATWLIKGKFLEIAPNAPRTGNTQYIAASLLASF